MSDIPKARLTLKALKGRVDQIRGDCLDTAHDLAGLIDQIEVAMLLLDRRKSLPMVRGTRAKMTPVLALKIRAWKATHLAWTQQRIAEKFNVTNARVSYALRGEQG